MQNFNMKQIRIALIMDPADKASFRHVKQRISGGVSPWMAVTGGGLNTYASPLIDTYWTMYFAFSDPAF
jgi:hypothetical protein